MELCTAYRGVHLGRFDDAKSLNQSITPTDARPGHGESAKEAKPVQKKARREGIATPSLLLLAAPSP